MCADNVLRLSVLKEVWILEHITCLTGHQDIKILNAIFDISNMSFFVRLLFFFPNITKSIFKKIKAKKLSVVVRLFFTVAP